MNKEKRLIKFNFSDFKNSIKEADNRDGLDMTNQEIEKLYRFAKTHNKDNYQIPGGNCMVCDKVQEKIPPITHELCASCSRKVIERDSLGEKRNVEQITNYNGVCFLCLRKANILFSINFRMCSKCSDKLRRNYKEYKEHIKELDRKKPKPIALNTN